VLILRVAEQLEVGEGYPIQICRVWKGEHTGKEGIRAASTGDVQAGEELFC
jgi:hypothetical protein